MAQITLSGNPAKVKGGVFKALIIVMVAFVVLMLIAFLIAGLMLVQQAAMAFFLGLIPGVVGTLGFKALFKKKKKR